MDISKDFEIKEICTFTIRELTEEEKIAKEQRAKKEREIWFKIEPIFKEVSEEEFKKFIKDYPRKLDRDVCGISDPPSISYNDFELANRWPWSIVANTMGYSDDPKDYWYTPEDERHYRVLENYKELFEARTGYKEE